MSDLRMGVECGYVFNFVVGKQTESGVQATKVEKFSQRPDLSKVGGIWNRIWDPTVKLSPVKDENGCPD